MKINRSRLGAFVGGVVVSGLILGACGASGGLFSADDDDGAGDAPIARAEDTPWVILNGVDRYPNIAFRCFGHNGIYAPRNPDKVASRTFQVVPNDPQCP